MPPKAKFTKDEILNTALSITEESGIDAVTARELGKRLGSSARPIFTVFESMDEIKHSVIMKAKESQPQINSRRILWLSFPGSAFSLAGNFFTTDTAGVFLLLYY